MSTYYNETDPFAAQWLRNLIAAGHIASGEVDERSIEDVRPVELAGFAQCHFFAGIGVWSYALRCAGWDDDRPVWTGSCPCQPFSAAGKGGGFSDERHLWPAWFHLIEVRRPGAILGEQVADRDGLAWLDLVHSDLEGAGYTFAALDLCGAGFGSPDKRQRLYFVADAESWRRGGEHRTMGGAGREDGAAPRTAGAPEYALGRCGSSIILGDTEEERWGSRRDAGAQFPENGRRKREPCGPGTTGVLGDSNGGRRPPREPGGEAARHGGSVEPDGAARVVADTAYVGRREGGEDLRRVAVGDRSQGIAAGSLPSSSHGDLADTGRNGSQGTEPAVAADRGRRSAGPRRADQGRPGPVNGFWRDADWIFCRDGRWRPVEPGTFPLASRSPGPVGQLRAYGNAIKAPVATAFIQAVMECIP